MISLFIMYVIGIAINLVFNVLLNIYAILDPCPAGTLFNICPESNFLGLNITLLVLGLSNTIFSFIVVTLIRYQLMSIVRLFVYPNIY